MQATPDPLDLSGRRVDKYDIVERVGHGGMAVVYRGVDRVLNREVAIKVLHPHLADSTESRERLHREALTVARLAHPNIVEIFDYSSASAGSSYIVTEFIRGQTLKAWLESKVEPRPALAAMIVFRLCAALDHAHELGIVHRDIKPENVMIRDDGRLKLMDFGIAQILDQQKLTLTGQLLGSPAYMAPELISGRPIDARTDVFSLGILLYQLSTGQLPFSGRNPHEVLSKISLSEYEPASRVNPHVDAELDTIICRALEREPAQRHQSASELAQALEGYLGELEVPTDSSELERYFSDPSGYTKALDTRLCELFIARGEQAASVGQHARALRLLSHVLELDPGNLHASRVLDRLHRRGRRMRWVMRSGATLAFAGVLSAAGVLIHRAGVFSGDGNSNPSSTTGPEGKDSSRAEAGASKATRPDSGNSFLAFRDFKALPDYLTEQFENVGRAAEGPPDPTPEPTQVEAKPPSAATRAAARDREGRNEDKDDDRSQHRTRRPAAHPDIEHAADSAKPAIDAVTCRVRVEGLPVTTRRHFALSWQKGPQIPLTAQSREAIEFTTPAIQGLLRLVTVDPSTPAHHTATLRIDAASCTPDMRPLAMHARPKPAELIFEPRNFSSTDLIIQCVENCGRQLLKPSRAHRPRSFRLPDDSLEETVIFELRAQGFRSVKRALTVHPGINRFAIELEPTSRSALRNVPSGSRRGN